VLKIFLILCLVIEFICEKITHWIFVNCIWNT
jgi:hypothetical protein